MIGIPQAARLTGQIELGALCRFRERQKGRPAWDARSGIAGYLERYANNDADMAMAGDDRILIVEDVRAFVAPGIGVDSGDQHRVVYAVRRSKGQLQPEPQKSTAAWKVLPKRPEQLSGVS
jgi:hypothetical protein